MSGSSDARHVLQALVLISAALMPITDNRAADGAPVTFTYKQVEDVSIQADVYNTAPGESRPVLVWIHGGALIGGNRTGMDRRICNPMREAGCVVVSIDYRLAPETKLPEIVADLEDAFRWVREKGPELFGADPQRIGVAGGSAGGYLTLTSGFRVKPPVQALVALYGYGDLIGDWYSTASPHPRHNRNKPTEEEARAQVSGPPIADDRDRKGKGFVFYEWCRQHGAWPKEVSGWDPHKEPEKFYPFMPLKNVTAEYPPTVLIHGTADTDVPYEQSVMMAAEFDKHGVEHQFITLENGEHGFDGADQQAIAEAYAAAVSFLKAKLGVP